MWYILLKLNTKYITTHTFLPARLGLSFIESITSRIYSAFTLFLAGANWMLFEM
jgi:hypothetical protein